MKSMTIRMEDELHKNLKVVCASQGISIQDYVVKLISESIQDKLKSK